jgi:hypothetical protein
MHPRTLRDGLLRFARNDGGGALARQGALELARQSCATSCEKFFTRFVDGMFTTFIAHPFTNTSDALDEIRAITCV